MVGMTVVSAILAKEAESAPPLARVIESSEVESEAALTLVSSVDAAAFVADPLALPRVETGPTYPAGTRFFNGRPIRAIKTVRMRVTAYSPDERSCGDSADGYTATLHHVTTNAHRLVAADPRLLPYGSMVSIAGYDEGRVVPVLDCGGAIKGRRIDVLLPTHEEAIRWGSQWLDVVVWGYADGKPNDNPRKLR